MTPSQAYKAALEVAAKIADDYDDKKHMLLSGPPEYSARYTADEIAAAIRTLPMPSELEKP